MKRLPVIVGFLFILFVFGFIGAPRALSETLVVAHLAPMSGTAAGWGIATDRAIRMAVDDFNARGGLKIGKETYKIQLVTMDHRYVPGEALGATKKVAGEGIKYAFGVGAGIMPAMQPVLTENKVINMVSMGAGVEFTNAKNPYTFRTMPSSELGYAVYYPKLVKMFGPLKIGVVHNNDELGRADTRCRERVIKEKNLPIEEVVEFV
jgi:branched-chain amino acid transport system substrate-binding protein